MNYPEFTRREIGLRIRRERTLWNLTQEEFSNLLGISTNYLGQIERGTRDLSRKVEDRICEVFQMTHEEFHRNIYGHLWVDTVSESGSIFHDLSEDDLVRLIHSCSYEELQFCGHIIRSTLHYLRNTQPHRLVTADPDNREVLTLQSAEDHPEGSTTEPIPAGFRIMNIEQAPSEIPAT